MKLERNIDVLVLGYYGFGNLGDELLAEAVVRNLVSAGIQREKIVLLSADPQKSESRTGVKCYNRWNLGTVSALLKQSKSFLLGGGGLFQDVTSVKSCGYYWWVVRAAKMSGTKIWAVSQSVGPLKSMLGKYFTKNALKNCAYLSVRDRKSSALLDSIGVESYETAPDLVMDIQFTEKHCGGDTLLLNLRPGYDAAAESAVRIANFTAKRNKLKIIGVAFAREDQVYLENLQADDKIKLRDIVLCETAEAFEKLAVNASQAVGMRLHFAELCALASLPAAMSAYDPKVAAFCEEWKLPVLTEKLSDKFAAVDCGMLQAAREKIVSEFRNGLAAVLQ
ncbi:MAG: polysaccharide pyruvyl transferase family protein [Synergistaceae bacterium]|nr:polysaccharide pyruvyl transferase family protein [Synergistaceae bacterium]